MSKSNIAPLVDELGQLRAEMADLEKRASAIKETLIEAGIGAYEGNTFRATVSKSTRNTLDLEAVREKLSPQFIRSHTKSSPVISVRVVARTVDVP